MKWILIAWLAGRGDLALAMTNSEATCIQAGQAAYEMNATPWECVPMSENIYIEELPRWTDQRLTVHKLKRIDTKKQSARSQ